MLMDLNIKELCVEQGSTKALITDTVTCSIRHLKFCDSFESRVTHGKKTSRNTATLFVYERRVQSST